MLFKKENKEQYDVKFNYIDDDINKKKSENYQLIQLIDYNVILKTLKENWISLNIDFEYSQDTKDLVKAAAGNLIPDTDNPTFTYSITDLETGKVIYKGYRKPLSLLFTEIFELHSNSSDSITDEILDNSLEIKEMIKEELQFTHKDFFVWLIAIFGIFGIALAIIFFIL